MSHRRLHHKKDPKTEQPTIENEQENDKLERKLLRELQKRYSKHKDKFFRDTLLRFVRGFWYIKDYKERYKTSVDYLDKFVKQYDKHNIGTILHKEWDQIEQQCLKAWPMFYMGEDKQGHPVMYDQLVSTPDLFVKAFADKKTGKVDMKRMIKFRLRVMRRLAYRRIYLQNKYNKMIYKHIIVLDVSNVTLSFAYKYQRVAQEVIAHEQYMYPAVVYKMFVVNSGWFFSGIWTIYQHFVHPVTQKKISVCKDVKAFKKQIVQYVNLDQIPTKFGGSNKNPIVWGEDYEIHEYRKLLQEYAIILNNYCKKYSRNEKNGIFHKLIMQYISYFTSLPW